MSSEVFIRRPVMTSVATLSVVVFGVLSFLKLPVNDLPAVDYPVIQVQASYPGASPETVANNISTPLELLSTMITPANPAVLIRDFKTDKTYIITRSNVIRDLC